MNSPVDQYDFVIVGSGVGGLVSAAILSMNGNKVLVLEKNHQIGGSLQVFSRDKVVFDTGVHYVGSLDQGESLYQIFRYIGIMDDLKLHRLDEDCFDMIRLKNGTTFKHGQGYEAFKSGLLESFPQEGKAIEQFCDKIQEICAYFPLYNLDVDSQINYINEPEVLSISAWDYIESITDDKDLQSVLLGNGLLFAGEATTTPLYVVALITNSYLKGSYRFKNGGSQIAKLLTKKIHSLGGRVLKHQEVVEAHFEGTSLTAVETKSGDVFYGRNFISNTHPKLTNKIFGKEHFRNAYKHRIDGLENTVSSFMLYLSFKEDAFPYINHNIYAYDTDRIWETTDYNMDIWPEALFICTPATVNQGEYADSLSAMAYMSFDEVEKWASSFNTVSESTDRGEDYSAFKREMEERMIAKLEHIFPSIRDAIKGVYSSTPLTYKDYIGTDDGSLYGIKKDYKKILHSKIKSKTRIPNLYQTGQNLVFHGVLGASIGALLTCFNFIDSKELVEKIKNA